MPDTHSNKRNEPKRMKGMLKEEVHIFFDLSLHDVNQRCFLNVLNSDELPHCRSVVDKSNQGYICVPS